MLPIPPFRGTISTTIDIDMIVCGRWMATQIFFSCSPLLGEMIQFDLRIFFKWVETTN